ncbi:MAG: 3'(2'),5'-bisphosphate nucleotidase CysQ [Gammaproteobacteria bacterium]|nr:3'(2'),5'-bisphosphate nucleotidase CysQ [Gammaproteobacteria bacterium]
MSFAPDILRRLTDEALGIARLAGQRIVEVYGSEFDVSYKSDSTPVTTADMAAHDIIVEQLGSLSPSLPVLSEESETVSFEERHQWQTYWLVDPLDGTREFLRRNGEFSVNIALISHNRPIAGVIVAPVLDLAYFASAGNGAFKQTGQEIAQPIQVRPAPKPITVARSRNPKTGPRLQHFLDAIGEHDEIPMGSALKSCLVAEGAADIYARLGPTGEWDTAAAQCIVEEAGGHIQDTQQRDLVYNTRESLINPNFLVFGDDQVDWTQHLPPEGN